MLEQVSLGQSRFRTPGIAPDARGVALGQKGAVLFPSLDRLVAFFRAYGEDGSLDELLAGLAVYQVLTPLRTRETVVTFAAESSYRMDRASALARLAGGLVFTGTSRHFVKYRDAASPLGYDVDRVLSDPGELALYHDSFSQRYDIESEIAFRNLVLRLTPSRVATPAERAPSHVLVTAEQGLGPSLLAYLFRSRVEGQAAIAEWPAQSAFEDAPRRLYLLRLRDVPPRIVHLLASTPGTTVFVPVGDGVGIERSYRHPIPLESCASLFPATTLHLFRGDGRVDIVDPLPAFAPIRALVRAGLALGPEDPTRLGTPESLAEGAVGLTLRLAPSPAPWRRVVATVVGPDERARLLRLLYALPPRTLGALRVAVADGSVYLVDPHGIEGVPIGTFYVECARRVYAPAGLTIVPAVAPEVLNDLLASAGDGHVFFDPAAPAPRLVPESAFAPLTRSLVRALDPLPVAGDPLESPAHELPIVEYGPSATFPLWGALGGKPEKSPG
ncbi:MAG: hypothetical protein IT379_03575 [Deltaproteobacteria bacterium]|nr:hypothetical protein [Deltaproteobacteria bacterium]